MSRGSKIIVAWTCRMVPQRIKSGQHVTPETLTGYSMYRKLLPKFLDMIDMSFLEDKSKASRHGRKEHQKVLIRQKSAQTTI